MAWSDYRCFLGRMSGVNVQTEQRVFGQPGKASLKDVAMTYAQLRNPSKTCARSIVSLDVKHSNPRFCAKAELARSNLDLIFCDRPTMNVTPQYSVVDLHIGKLSLPSHTSRLTQVDETTALVR